MDATAVFAKWRKVSHGKHFHGSYQRGKVRNHGVH
jgi:hypothetical protein